MASQSDNINKALTDNPKIIHTPSLADPVIKNPDPNTAAAVITHGYGVTTTQQALQDHAAEGDNQSFWNKAFGGASKVVMGSLNWLSKPLQEVQRDYKYIHSVYTRHGIFEGLMATAAVAGGAALGTLVMPGEGTIAGGELAATLERDLFGHKFRPDSYKDSNDPNYKVSMGRDFSNLVGQVPGLSTFKNTNKGLGKVLSGTGDMAFDFAGDPLVLAAKARTAVKSGEFLTRSALVKADAFRSALPGVQDFLERNSLRMFSPEQMDKLWQAGEKGNIGLADRVFGAPGAQYHRALNEIADLASKPDGAGALVSKFPGLSGIAKYIVQAPGKEVTPKDVHDIFMQMSWDDSFMKAYATNGQAMVPYRTVLRSALSKSADKLRQGAGNEEMYLRANQANFFLPKKVQGASLIDAVDDAGQKIIDPVTGQPKQVVAVNADKEWNTPVAYRVAKAVVMPFSEQARIDAANGVKTAIAGKIRTFSGYVPYDIDAKTLELSTMKFDPNNESAGQNVYRMLRFSMPESMARQKTAEFIAGDLGQKKVIYAGAIHEMVKAAGVIDDPKFVRDVQDTIQTHVQTPLARSNYGVGYKTGSKASIVELPSGDVSMGAFEDHAGKFAIPDFRELKTAMRNTSNYGKIYGRIDDFAAKYTDGVFKPMALLTGGFGLRIAASELIPQIFRFGSLDVAKAKIAGAAQKMNYKLIDGEADAILHNATLAVSGGTDAKDFIAAQAQKEGKVIRKTIAKGLTKLADEKDLDLAARITIATRGHVATGATLTGHGIPAEQQEFMRQITELAGIDGKRQMIKPTGKFTQYTNGDTKFDLHYWNQLAHSTNVTSRKQIVADALEEIKAGKTADEAWSIAQNKDLARIHGVQYDSSKPNFLGNKLHPSEDILKSERSKLGAYSSEDPAHFASRRTDIMRNLFTGPEGDVNKELMQMIVDGEKPSLNYLRNLDIKLKPTAVAGQEYEVTAGPNLLNRITNFGFGKIIDPVVNGLSRQPLFFNHVKNEMTSLEFAVNKGFLTEEEATRIAMTRATYSMMPQIHNTALRTQFSILARNYLPFYFAQEQAMRRAGSLIASNPAAFRQYQLVQQGINNPGFVETDSLGSKHLTIPIVGEIGASFLTGAAALGLPVVGGLPVSATGGMQSLRTVLPEFTVPGVSPFVSVALNSLGSLDPVLEREIKKVVGGAGFNRSIIDQLIPNSPMRNAFKALNANEMESSFYNAMISSIASAQYHGQMPPSDASPLVKAAFLDRIKNNARSILWMKALISTWSPLAPSVSQEDPGLRDEFYNLMKQKSEVTGKNMTFPEALGVFLARHGDKAISYTIGHTESAVPGAMMPYTNEAISWIQNNKDLINSKNGTGAAFLIPQTTSTSGDAQAIHDELIKMHLRGNKTPDEFLKSVYIAAGNNFIYAQKPVHDKAMADLKAAGESQASERASWSAFVKSYGATNPIWEADYSSPIRTQNAVHAVEQLQNIFADKNPPQGVQADLVKGLLNDWISHNQAVQTYSSTYGQEAVTQEKENWQTYLDTMAVKEPRLNSVINSVFRRLA